MTGHGDWPCGEGERPHASNSPRTLVDIQRKPKDRNDCFTKKHIVSELSRTLDSERELTFQFSGHLNCGQFTLDYFLWCYSDCLPMVLRHYKPCTVHALKRKVTRQRNSDGVHWGWLVFTPCYVEPHLENSQARARNHLLAPLLIHLVEDPGYHMGGAL